jgi:hypothetical protein
LEFRHWVFHFTARSRSVLVPGENDSVSRVQVLEAYRGRKKTLTPERAAELVQRAANGIPKTVFATDYGISRETVYQRLSQAKPM